ncbi:MAG: glycerophosphodiester phosphodiesterase family protein [Tepidisphaeraceae bacterium]
MTQTLITSLLFVLSIVTISSAADIRGGARIDGDFTLTWNQRVDDPAATTQPAVRIGDFTADLRPAPKAKPKDPPAFNVALGRDDAAVRSKTLIYPGKWYHFALVWTGGKLQLFVNGFPDDQPQALTTPPAGALGVGSTSNAASNAAPLTGASLTSAPATPEQILSQFKQQVRSGGSIVTVAHRGIHKYAPENTRISYVQAVAAGAPILEFDTALTSDGHIIGMHDKTVDRTTDGAGKVAELTFEQIRKLEAGAWKDPKYKGEPVPALDEVAAVARDAKAILMLDLKAEGQGAAIAKWLESSKYPHELLMLAPWEDAEAVALRKHVPADVPMIRLTSKVPTDVIDDAYFAKMKSIGLSGFSVNWQYLTEAFTRGAQKNGMKVYAWTLNDPPDLAGAALLGVDGIVTDDSANTIKLLAELQKR